MPQLKVFLYAFYISVSAVASILPMVVSTQLKYLKVHNFELIRILLKLVVWSYSNLRLEWLEYQILKIRIQDHL